MRGVTTIAVSNPFSSYFNPYQESRFVLSIITGVVEKMSGLAVRIFISRGAKERSASHIHSTAVRFGER